MRAKKSGRERLRSGPLLLDELLNCFILFLEKDPPELGRLLLQHLRSIASRRPVSRAWIRRRERVVLNATVRGLNK